MINLKVPIAICTKGRFKTGVHPKTNHNTYQATNLGKFYEEALQTDVVRLRQVFIFVEPSEAELYAENYPLWPTENIIVLGADNQGLAYSRQTALQYFQSINCPMMVMIDDDCNFMKIIFNEVKDKMSLEKISAFDMVDEVSDWIANNPDEEDRSKVGMLGMEYQQFGWSKLPEMPLEHGYTKIEKSNHTSADCCVWWFPMIYKEHNISYDNFPLKCDRDFTAQVAASGFYTRKIFRYQMDSPLNGKAPGGCQDWYQKENQEAQECYDLLVKWNGQEWDENVPKSDFYLATLKEKKTSYGRSTDIRYFWQRIFRASRIGLKNRAPITKPNNLKEFNESINNFHPLG